MKIISIALIVLALAACTQAPSPPSQASRPPPPPVSAASRDSSQSPDQIRAVQTRLKGEGLYSGPVDGIWGPTTADALARWQTRQGLLPTGRLDTPTSDSLAPQQPQQPLHLQQP